MARSQAQRVWRHVNHLLESRAADDAQLLRRFVACREEDAFAALVARHGPLVLGVCNRLLRDRHEAEDVYQATFLVLAQNAATIRRPEALSCWLHGVAYRLALRARSATARRRERELLRPAVAHAEEADLSWCDVRALIDEELQRLPDAQRAPLVLCYLEGKTQDEAARQLGWARGTLKRRLERGRARLRARLVRRGVTLGAGLVAAALTPSATGARVPAEVAAAAVRAGVRLANGGAGGAAATRAALLARAALPVGLGARLKVVALALALVGCAAAAVGLGGGGAPAARPAAARADAAARPVNPRAAEPQKVRADRQGDALPEQALARLGTLRLRHPTMTASAVFTADGKAVIVGDGDGNVVYWDVATGREVRRLPRAPGVIHALALSADGQTLASATWGQLFLWDVAAGKLVSKGQLANDAVMQLAFTPDGKALAVRYQGDTLHLYDTARGKTTHELKGHTGRVSSMALSPDGKTLASGSWRDRHIRLWDVATGKEKFRFVAHEHDVTGVAYSPDGKTLASTGNFGFRLWDARTGKKLREIARHQPQHFAYLPDGRTLVGLAGDGFVHAYDAAAGKHLRQYDGPRRTMAQIFLAPDGGTAATVWGGAHGLDLWDTGAGKLLHAFVGHQHGITSLAFSADGRTLFSAGGLTDTLVGVWTLPSGELRGVLGEDGNGVNGLALAPDGKLLAACGYSDNTVRLWDATSRKLVHTFKGHTQTPVSVAWSADGGTLLSASSYDKTLRVWDATSGQRRTIEAPLEWSSAAALSPDGKLVAAGGFNDGTVRVWDAATGKELRRLQGPPGSVHAVAFSPGGRDLAAAASSGLLMYEVDTGRLVKHWGEGRGWVGALAFSADGRALVSGHSDHTVRLWEVATGKERACFTGHRGPVRAVALSRDGRAVASGSEDTAILAWDATGGRLGSAPSVRRLQALWADLAGDDAARAHRALWQLALAPEQALPFLRERLRPAPRAGARELPQVKRLLVDLDSKQFAVRLRAEAELEELGPAAESAVRQALEGGLTLEVRRRLGKALDRLAGSPAERLRTARAVEAVERMGTAEARELLDALAGGAPGAWLTREAGTARHRLGGATPERH